ncbi:MAG: hypothetical protein RLY86_151 [Pseudomonadota bacterium]|jgi:DNA (cytosine-5)-methyltransferase 1
MTPDTQSGKPVIAPVADTLFDLPEVRRFRQPRAPRPLPGTSAAEPWPLDGAINVVLFAGMGGWCKGLEKAGYPVHIAVNHDSVAIAAHRAMNPHTRHLHADIYEVCPLDATGGREVNVLHASPDCRDHSVAKGGAPRSPRVRSMPWQVCRWVGRLRKRGLGPRIVTLENVREIRGWGRLVAKRDPVTKRVVKLDGSIAAPGERVPVQQQQLVRDPRHAGTRYRAWVRHMQRLGCTWEDRDLNCADYGMPTSRKRLFGVGLFGGRRPAWPVRTHAPRTHPDVLAGKLLPHRAAAEVIDWSLPLPSIFDRARPLAQATLRRVAVGMRRYVLESASPYIVHITHHGQRPPVDMAGPLPTITAAHRGELAVCGPALVPTTHSASPPRVHGGQGPVPTLTAGVKGGELAVMAATIVGAGGRAAQVPPMDIAGPLNTTTTKEDRCVVAAHLTELRSRSVGQAASDPLATQTQREHHGLIGAWMVQHNGGTVGNRADEPVSTMTTRITQQQVAGAYLTELRGTATAADVAEPLGTQTAGGHHEAVTCAFLHHQYSTGGQHDAVDDPLATQSTRDRTMVTGAQLCAPLTGPQLARARQVADFLRAYGAWSGGDIVTLAIDGRTWVVADIGMRMLSPAEAAAAHWLELPARIWVQKKDRKGATIFDAAGKPVWHWRPLTKSEGMRLIGNSVPSGMPEVLMNCNPTHTLAVAAE